jgi:RHS repeat-associated protein
MSSSPTNSRAATAGLLLALLAGGITPTRAQYNTAYYFGASSYTGVEGGSFSGTVFREGLYTGCQYTCDWFPNQPATVLIYISPSGTYPISSTDLVGFNTNGGQYYVTIPGGATSAPFNIPLTDDGVPYYDRTGTLNIGNGYVDSTKVQSAALTLQDIDESVGVSIYYNGTNYSGTTLWEGGTGGANSATIHFFRNVSVTQARTINYSVGGNAVSNVDYTPAIGTITIPQGSDHVDVTITAANTAQTTNTTLTVQIAPGLYTPWPGATNITVTIIPDYPNVGVFANNSAIGEGSSGSFTVYRNPAWTVSPAKNVSYSVGGTAIGGTDYSPALTRTVTIPAGSASTTLTVNALTENLVQASKSVSVSLTSGAYTIDPAYPSAAMSIVYDYSIVSLTAPVNNAFQSGQSGQFSVTRIGGLGSSLPVTLSFTGTATSGVNYTALPTTVVFAPNQTVTNLVVTPATTPALSGAVTVVATVLTNSAYFLGPSAQDVVTLLPASDATNSVPSPAGRYWRGTGSNPAYWSIVVPLDYEKGALYDNLYGNCSALYPGLYAWSGLTLYHYDATNTLPQTNVANRFAFNNPIVAFGERVGGTPLYFGQNYSFGIYAGDPLPLQAPVQVLAYYRTNYGYAGVVNLYPPNFFDTNSWNSYTTNGFEFATNGYGLTTTLSGSPTLSWGSGSRGGYVLTHTATEAATNYYYLVVDYGYLDQQGTPMVLAGPGQAGGSYLYSLEFEQRPLWRSVFLDQPHFDGSPLPPFYAGKTLAEILTNSPPVTNAVALAPSLCTNLDDSPELRRHPILDQFVADMGNDPVALANYVLNEIELTDPMDYNDNGNIAEESINEGGVSRDALAVFMEKQGSPTEQCALLVYLLRQAGVPAAYVYPPHNGLKILDARLSRTLKFQVHGGYGQAGGLYTTNSMIAVNYPWVAAYTGTNWVQVFPWLKDYELQDGLDLYDYTPTNYPSAFPWVRDYVYGATNLLSLAVDGDNTPRAILPRFLAQTLGQTHPGVSLDNIGSQVLNRPHYYARWQDFPTPTWTTNTSIAIRSLTDSAITNVSPLLTNIFNTLSVEIYSVANANKDIRTGDLRLTDLHNRLFYITQSNSGPNQVQLSLVLAPFRTNITTQAAFTNDPALLSKEMLSMTLDQFDDQLRVRFGYRRHRSLTPAYPLDSAQSFLGYYTATHQLNLERPMRKGDLAALCLSYGRVTRDMLSVHAQDLWQMQGALRANPSLTNSLSTDLYQGTTMYLAGMSYYERVSEFDTLNQRLHKVNELSLWAAGLSGISAHRNSDGTLYGATVDPILPYMDMFFYEVAAVGNGTLRPDSGRTKEMQQENYSLFMVTDNSAEEHETINSFYQQTNALSTVRLLQLAQARNQGIVQLNINNYLAQGQAVYQGQALQNWDAQLWQGVFDAFQNSSDYGYVTAYLTPGPITNAAYKGMGALVLGWSQYSALITPGGLNGAYGEYFPFLSFTPPNTPNWQFTSDQYGSLTGVNLVATATATLPPSQTAAQNVLFTYNQINNGSFVLDPYTALASGSANNLFNLPGQSSANLAYGQSFLYTAQNGNQSQPNDAGSQMGARSADPVNNMTGEFYVDETDLGLPGPIPLAVRRNYSSQNLADNQFGSGWKLSLMPYLSVSAGATNIYAADMDGAVLAYVQTATNANVWLPTLSANPQLNNNTTAGVGGLANRLRDRLVQTVNGPSTNYTLYGADGSVRTFQAMTFNNGSLSQTRPYLQQWTDNRGNFYTFQYGTNATQTDFGQVRRIQCSNGNYLGFYFDIYGHIIEAYSGDGRRLRYQYDQFGDLVTVTLPDATTRSYVYQHATMPVTNGTVVTQQPYSTHLIIEEDRPDGRALLNAYDSQRRVTNQLSTAGQDLNPVRTATFIYANNFNITNSYTNAISGYTLLIDGNGFTNRFDYTNSLITQITDPLGQTIQQTWYPDNASAPSYPRSVASRVDKRGLLTQFQYDSSGNVTNTIVTGDLTGDGISNQTATNTAVYNAHSLPLQTIDPRGNSTVFVYDPVFTFLPQQVTRYAGATPVSTNFIIYGSVTNVFTQGGASQTNFARGLPVRQIRAYGSTDAATNDAAFDAHGFRVQTIRFTSTSNPAFTNNFFYNERGEEVDELDALGALTHFEYDDIDRPTEQWNVDEHGYLLSWNFNYYNDNGELEWRDGPAYDPEDYVWWDHDGAGRVTTEIHWRAEAKTDGTGVQAPAGYDLYAQSFFSYDVMGNRLRSVDPRGAITTNIWDRLGRLSKRTHLDLDGVTALSTESFAYEPGGLEHFSTNALGGFTQTEYTTAGQPKYRLNPDGSTNGWRYYLDGRVHREIQRNGAYWETTYDDANRKTTRTFYSSAGAALATNSVVLDRRGNVIQRVDAGFNVFTNLWDGLDRLKVSAGPAVVTVFGTTNAPVPFSGLVTSIVQQVTTRIYDAASRVLVVSNALGEKVVTTSDMLGRALSQQTFAAGASVPLRVTSYSYSADHHSVTRTDGSGSDAIVSTTFTDNDGRTLLSVGYPAAGALEYTWHQYDLAGNLVYEEHDSSTNSAAQGWSGAAYQFDGLNRLTAKSDRDNALTYYLRDAAGNVTNRVMPGGLQWSAVYNNAGQILQEWNTGAGGAAAQTNTYAYFPGSSPFAGLLLTRTDGLSDTCTYAYDSFLRTASTTREIPLDPVPPVTTVWNYDARGFATNISESIEDGTVQVTRSYDAFGQLTVETIQGGGANSAAAQVWNSAGRRASLTLNGKYYAFAWRADGLLASVSAGGPGASYAWSTAGLLTNRLVGSRMTSISSRDGAGRPLSINTTVNTLSVLNETLAWTGDGLLDIHTLARQDFTDARAYSYAGLSRRLTNEVLNLDATGAWTNLFAYDGGAVGGLGVLTGTGQASTAARWSGVPDALSRIGGETNTAAFRVAYGRLNGQAAVTALLDGHPMPLEIIATGDATWSRQWRATLELTPGAHQLVASAAHPSGFFTTNAAVWFTNSAGNQTVSDVFDPAGHLTERIWKGPTGAANRTQTLYWDAKGRLSYLFDLDSQGNGFDWYATYDGLDRRLYTWVMMRTNGSYWSDPYHTIAQYFDPSAEFLELGVTVDGLTTWKLYGPDLNGAYGGLNGTGGLDAVIPDLKGLIPTLSDARGNVLGEVVNGAVTWNPSRPTGYGAVPGWRPVTLGASADLPQSAAWRGRWPDLTGYVWLGARYYNPESGTFLNSDPLWNARDPNYYSFCGGDPINLFDFDGRCSKPGYDPTMASLSQWTPGAAYDTTLRARDIAGGAIDEAFNNLALGPFMPWDFSSLDLRAMGASDAPEVRAYDAIAQNATHVVGSPAAQIGFSNPNSSGYTLGQAGADAGLFVLSIEGVRGKMGDSTRPVSDPVANWQEALRQAQIQLDISSAEAGSLDFYNMSRRSDYMGSTPGKYSPVGLQVIQRMAEEGQIRVGDAGLEVLNSANQWVPVATTDMSHIVDAVNAWNDQLYTTGAKSPEVRQFMTDPNNYELDSSSINRSKGASLGQTYRPPAGQQ